MSFLISNSDYTAPVYSLLDPDDFSKIEYDLKCLNRDKYQGEEIKDPRFSQPSWANVHGCAAFSLAVYYYVPSSSLFTILVKPFSLALLPGANAVDFTINLVSLVFQIPIALDQLMVKVLIKTSNFFLSSKNKLPTIFKETNFLKTLGKVRNSFFHMIIDVFMIPFWWIGFGPGLNTSYWVFNKNTKKYELVLDQNKVKWIREKYGYNQLTEDQWKKISIPDKVHLAAAPFPGELQISYENRKGSLKPIIEAQWVEWEPVYNCSDTKTNFYNRIYKFKSNK